MARFRLFLGATQTVTALTLTADSGSYSMGGQVASLEYGREAAANAGSYAFTGQTATLRKGLTLAANSGAYALTGQTASLEFGREVAANAGAYALTGQAASLEYGREVAAAAGAYTLTGTDAGLIYTSQKTLAADAGSYAIVGQDSSLEFGRLLSAEGGAYILTGTDATLVYTTRVPTPDTGAGAGHKKKRRIPPIRLANGMLYHPDTWQEFNQILAAIEYRIGEPPYVPIKRTNPVKIGLTPVELVETYKKYLNEVIPTDQMYATDQRIIAMESRLGIMESQVDEELAQRDRRRRMLLLLS